MGSSLAPSSRKVASVATARVAQQTLASGRDAVRCSLALASLLLASIVAMPAAEAQYTWSGAAGGSGTAAFNVGGNWLGGNVPASGTLTGNGLRFQNGQNTTIFNMTGTFGRTFINSTGAATTGTVSSWTFGTLGDAAVGIGSSGASINYGGTAANQIVTFNMPILGVGSQVNLVSDSGGRMDFMGGFAGTQQFNFQGRIRIGGTSTLSGARLRNDSGMTTLLSGSAILGTVSQVSALGPLMTFGNSTGGGVWGLTTASGDFVRHLATSLNQGGFQWTNANTSGGWAAVDSNRSVTIATSTNSSTAITGTWGSTSGFIGNSGTMIFGNSEATGHLTFTNNFSLGNASGTTRTIRADRGSSSVADGTLSGVVSGTGNCGKVGGGFLRMTGANTYSGTTFITAGRLEVAGSGNVNSASPVVVNGAGAELKWNSSNALASALTLQQGTLSGTGSINTNVSVGTNATISPGNSPGVQNYTQGLTWASGGSYLWEINDWTGSAGTNYDQVVVSGSALNITANSGGKFTINIKSLTVSNTAGNVPNFSNVNKVFTIATTGSLTNFSADAFSLNTAGFTSSPGATGTWSITGTGNAVQLNYNVTAAVTSSTYTIASTAGVSNIRVGGTTGITATVANTGADTSDSIVFNTLSVGNGVTLSPTSGTLAQGVTGTGAGTFTGATAGVASFSPSATVTNLAAGGSPTLASSSTATVTVWNPAVASVTSGSSVNLGRVITGATLTGTLAIQNAAPNDGFSESLNAFFNSFGGDVVSTSGSINLLAPQASNSTSMTVGLDTASAGVKTGTASVGFQTDGAGTSGLTAASLASQTLQYSGTVLAHSTASLASSLLTSTTITLGQWNWSTSTWESGTSSENFSLFNIASTVPASLTAALNVTGTSFSGDSQFSSTFDLGSYSLINGGSSSTFSVVFNPTTTIDGEYLATFTFNTADENLPGGTAGQTLTLTARVIVVPEPASIGLSGVGLAFAGLMFWRRRRPQQDNAETARG